MSGLAFLLLLAASVGCVLGFAATKFQRRDNPLVEQINALLPQTQCGQCNYPGCKPYAKAIAEGKEDIDKCPPGGQQVVIALADLLNRPPSKAVQESAPERVAWIDEERCIGCVLCIKACPVDAIVGSTKFMHTVIAAECTGCELCVPACPVDCIEMRVVKE